MSTTDERRARIREKLRNAPSKQLAIRNMSLEEMVRQQGETIDAAHRTIKEQADMIKKLRGDLESFDALEIGESDDG